MPLTITTGRTMYVIAVKDGVKEVEGGFHSLKLVGNESFRYRYKRD